MINIEVTAQILDALAFLLVTPEFLGEHTLISIRAYLHKLYSSLRKLEFPVLLWLFTTRFWVGNLGDLIIIPNLPIVGFILWWIILLLSCIGLVVLSVFKHVPGLAWELLGFMGVLGALPILAAVLLVTLHGMFVIASKLVVRRIMFSIGVVLFFLARGILVWHALEPGTALPAEHHLDAPR